MSSRGFSLIEVVIALAIITVLMATVGLALSEILDASDYARNLNIANFESQTAISEMSRTLRASSKRDGSPYRPRNYNGELAFRMVYDFSVTEERAIYTDFFICYYRDQNTNTLRRRFRKVDGNNPGAIIYRGNVSSSIWNQITSLFGDLIDANNSNAHQVIARYITNFNFNISTVGSAIVVKLEVTSTVGEGKTRVTVTKAEDTVPFNWD